jgi:fumarate hydratase subunit alpha/L(+)-tartrate dehydratase alpha subunit
LPGHRHPDIQRRPSGAACEIDGVELQRAIRRGCERATQGASAALVGRASDHAQERAHLVRPGVPPIHVDFCDDERLVIEMIPKGSGSENNSWLQDGDSRPRAWTRSRPSSSTACSKPAARRVLPPSWAWASAEPRISALALAKQAATRPLGTSAWIRRDAALEIALTEAVNTLGVGPQGLGGDSTSFAVHVEVAATHITMNPVAVNMQCHSARRACASFTPAGIEYGF